MAGGSLKVSNAPRRRNCLNGNFVGFTSAKREQAMEAEMVRGDLTLDWRRPSVIGGTVAVVILMVASMARAQTVNSRGQPLPGAGPTLQHRVADAGHDGG